MDADLFMECQDEELDPCQMVDDDVDEDDWDFQDEDNHSGEEQMDSCEKPWSKEEEPPDPPKPAVTTASTLPTPQVPARTITTNTSTTSITTTGTLNNATPNMAALTTSPAALLSPSISNQGQQVFLTQTPAGQTFWLPPGPGGGAPQQILLTTQGFPGGAGRPFQMTRLVLNMAPGSSLQPLTFIQSPPLAPLAPPRVPPPVGTVRPTYLTLPISQSAASATKLSSAPIVSQQRIVTATATPPTPALSASAPPSAPKVVMTVEEFYYGRAEGNQKEPIIHNENLGQRCFQCQICRSRLMNNIGLMQHMLCHCEVIMVPKVTAGGREEDVTTCRECYRLFSSPQQLKNHQNLVHTPTTYPSICKICDWAFDDETIFLNHMKTNHKPGEMPYTCQVCSFRSSFYCDVVNHFKACHSGYFHLMCVFCLKVFKTSQSYQGHFLRHKKGQGFHCNKCRLQFVLLKDKMDHKHMDHKSFQRPEQLKGLPAGAKVTIRLSHPTPITMPVTPRSPITHHPAAVPARPAPPPYPVTLARPAPLLVRPINIKTEEQRQPITANPRRRRIIGRKPAVSTLRCMECGTDASDLFAHFPTYVRCLLCVFSTCCSQAYASHMIHKHVPHTAFSTPLHRRSPPCPYQLRCSSCDFVPQTGDQMAKHLVFNPHHSSICTTTTFVEPDMNFYAAAKQAQRAGPGSGQKVENTPDAAWLQARNWTEPFRTVGGGGGGFGAGFVAAEFTHGCGPHHGLPKNADAVDYFTLLFPDSLVELVAAETNAHAKTCQYLGGTLGGSGTSDWVPVTADDIRGFLGLVILMGTKNLPDLSQYWSWTHNDNGYTFYRAMSFNRFKQIAANIRMGSETTDKYRGRTEEGDPLCIFRPMLELLGSAMWTIYRPRCCLTIDRALLPQPIKGPPGTSDPRSQPEIWLLCDSKSGYCHRVSIQGGVVGEKAGLETGFRVVPKLVEGLENKHHQLYLAKSLASAPLMAKLLDEAIYASSSFPPPSPILPAPLWDNGRLDKAGDFLQRAFGPLLATRWRDAKEMGCLSTNATPGGADTVWRRSQTKAGELDPIQRPMAFRLLQENMRGVDICKQLLACNPLGGVPEDKYWRRLFWFLVNLSVVNAFILLRESRKDHPPSWVQGGLFSQLVFRKRLGNQLAKCAQKAFEPLAPPPLGSSQEALSMQPLAAGSRVARGGARASEEEPLKQRHRIVKVSFSSRRCKNCMKKNIRRESVYGCGVCQINLCKQGHCFWEFHGLSPLTQGSTKIGFVKDKISGQVEFSTEHIPGDMLHCFGVGKAELDDSTPIDEIDEAMAPIEEIDSSGDEEEEEEKMEEELRDYIPGFLPAAVDHHDMTEEFRADVEGGEYDEPPSSSPPPPLREDALSARQLRICLLALCGGLRQASTDFNTQPQMILAWLKERRKQLKQESGEQKQQEKQQQEKASLSEGEVDMLEWVLAMWEQQAPITESSLFQKATVLRKKGSFGSSFRISYDWALGFMLQHGLGLRRPGRRPTLSRVLPPSLEERTRRFRDFTRRQILASRLPAGAVAAMDELCVFVDFNLLHESCTVAQRVEALKLWGSGGPLLTVYLTALSDGTVLPGLVLLRSHRSWPASESLLIEARPVAFTVEDGMDLWSGGVWRRHLDSLGLGPRSPRKNLLVVDGHREHLSQMFLCALAASATLPAVVPAGCNHRLHPLDACLRPVLQRYLLHRWARAMAEPLQDVASAEHLEFSVSHLLVDCLGEALGRLAHHTHLMKRSFQLAGILPGGGEGSQEEIQNPEEVQAQLLHSLWEALVEGEAVEEGEESTDELEEIEDEEEQEDAKEGEEELREERKEPEEERREEEAKTRTGEEPTAEEAKRKADEEEVTMGEDGEEMEEIKTGVDGEGTTERRCLTEEHGETVPTCP